MMAVLEGLRDALATIPGVASCKIGLESNISPADYPLIRVVPSRFLPGTRYNKRIIEATIYFGMDSAESESGIEGVYSALLTMESAIRAIVVGDVISGKYIDTITDEDRLDTYKVMAMRCEVMG